MATETADDLRKEAAELGGASRSTASGLKRPDESQELSKDSDQDIENKDVHVEDQEQEGVVDEEAKEDEGQLESGQEGELEPKSEEGDDSEDDADQQEDDQDDDSGQDDGKKKTSAEDKGPKSEDRRGNKDNAARRVERKQGTDKDRTIEELTSKVQQYEQAESQREESRIEDEIKALATELKSDPAGLTKVLRFAEKLAVRKVEQILKDRLPSKEVVDSIKQKGTSSKFDLEFSAAPVQEYISSTYPRATAKQVADAKNLLRRLSNGSKYPLDYFFMKNRKDFDSILDVRRRRGLETSRRSGTDVEIENRNTDSSKGVDNLDKKYREDQSGSGLRRERTSEKTF